MPRERKAMRAGPEYPWIPLGACAQRVSGGLGRDRPRPLVDRLMLTILQNRQIIRPGSYSAGTELRHGSSNLAKVVKVMDSPR